MEGSEKMGVNGSLRESMGVSRSDWKFQGVRREFEGVFVCFDPTDSCLILQVHFCPSID